MPKKSAAVPSRNKAMSVHCTRMSDPGKWARAASPANIGTSDTSGTSAPKTDTQRAFIEALDSYHMVLALGPAGTGKTYLSIAKAVEALEAGDVQRSF